MESSQFGYAEQELAQLAEDALKQARALGASACEAEVSTGFGQNVSVRLGEVETIEYTRDKGLSVTVYMGQRRGHASSSDLSPTALRDTVAKAAAIARLTAEDAYAGLADPALLARDYPDLDLHHPWALSVDEAVEWARSCEAAALAVDPRVNNSEGASIGSSESLFVYANSHGFVGGYPSSRHDIGCAVIAESDAGMQRDYWFSTARCAEDLEPVATVGRMAGERTLKRIDARPVATTQAPVLFEAPLAAGLIAHLVSAISGGSLYRRSSFLLDSLGRQLFPSFVQIDELPHVPRGLGSSPFDNEGVTTQSRALIDGGVLTGYLLGSYSARKLGMQTTGNAGGNHNLVVRPGNMGFEELVRHMHRGLVVTELLGHGVNPVTGDYSRGAAGFWVENGVIVHPVEEVTIAGNLKQMFQDIVAIGSDVMIRGARQTGSILVSNMTIAGQG